MVNRVVVRQEERGTHDVYLREVLEAENFHIDEYLEVGMEIVYAICEEVSRRLKVDRWLIAGSIGKGTWLGIEQHTDFDLVLLFNPTKEGAPPSHVEILDTIEEMVQENCKRSVPFLIRERTKYTVQCKYYVHEFGWINIDIVPGLNFIKFPMLNQHPHLTQMNETFKYIQEHGGNDRLPFMSASLAEAVVKFVGDEDEFTHELIKLCKLWNKRQEALSDTQIGKINGRSYTMEVVAIKVARQEKSKPGKQRLLVEAFKKFLSIWTRSRNKIRVVFPFRADKTLRKAKLQHQNMAIQGGVILDPCNPWNNLLEGFNDEQLKAFQEVARRSLRWIEQFPPSHGIKFCFPKCEKKLSSPSIQMPEETCCAIS